MRALRKKARYVLWLPARWCPAVSASREWLLCMSQPWRAPLWLLVCALMLSVLHKQSVPCGSLPVHVVSSAHDVQGSLA